LGGVVGKAQATVTVVVLVLVPWKVCQQAALFIFNDTMPK